MSIANTFKDRLMGALHSAVGHFNAGSDPNTAVVKAAQENDFNADQATRLVETFNTARTIYHYKSAADRTAGFELADPAAVIPLMFKVEAQAKTASVNHDYSSYDIPEARYEDGLDVKAAGVRDFEFGTPVDYADTNLDAQGARAMQALHVQRDLAETARGEASIAGTKAAQILSKVAMQISRGYEDRCLDAYGRLQTGYYVSASPAVRDQWGPVMAKFAEFVPSWLDAGYRGMDFGNVIDDRDLGQYTEQLKEAKYWMEAESEMLAVAGQLDKEADAFEREWMEIIAPVLPRQQERTCADFLSPSLRKLAQQAGDPFNINITMPKDKEQSSAPAAPKSKSSGPGFFGGLAADAAKDSMKAPMAGAVDSGLKGLIGAPTEAENKGLSERLKNVQRQIMLEDLMVNDPVLGDEDPQVVVQAYQTVLGTAPELAMNKEVVRAILRQAVHSVAISPYEAQVWTDLEKNIRHLAGKSDAMGRAVSSDRK